MGSGERTRKREKTIILYNHAYQKERYNKIQHSMHSYFDIYFVNGQQRAEWTSFLLETTPICRNAFALILYYSMEKYFFLVNTIIEVILTMMNLGSQTFLRITLYCILESSIQAID
jgi:hypothetical protein